MFLIGAQDASIGTKAVPPCAAYELKSTERKD